MKCPRSAPSELRTGALLVCGMFSKPSPVPACGDVAGGSWASLAGGVPCLSWTYLVGPLVPVAVPRRSGAGGASLRDGGAALLKGCYIPTGLLWTQRKSLLLEVSIPFPLVRALRELRATVGQLGFCCWTRYIFPAQHRPQLLKAFLAQAMLHVAALLRGNLGRYAGVL